MFKKIAFMLGFIAYLILLVLFVLLKFDGNFNTIKELYINLSNNATLNINLIPFRTILMYLKNINSLYAIINMLGNIVPFIPLGFFCLIIIKNHIWRIVLCLLIIFSIECIQLIFQIGFFDIDDIFLDIIGSYIGYLIARNIIHFKIK